MWEWANGSDDIEDLAITVAVVDSVVLTLYLIKVIVPRYANRIYDLEIRNLLRWLGIIVPLMILMGMIAMHGEMLDDPQQTRSITGVYIAVAMSVIVILRFIYQRFYVRKKDGKIETKKVIDSENDD